MVINFKRRSFGTRLVNLGGGNPPWVLEQISSKHCTNSTNGWYETWIFYNTLIKLYFHHYMWFLGRIGIQDNSRNLLVILRLKPPMVDGSKYIQMISNCTIMCMNNFNT